jgi:catechol 2,3-dioxygenase-like lactoylglutathione lyase family enzyme
MKRVLETCLYGTDLDAMEAFYGGLLGLQKQSREGDRHVFFRLDDGMLLIFNPDETVKPPPPHAFPVPTHGASGRGHVCFGAEADALDDLRRIFEDAGIAIDADFRWPNGARSVYVRDPAGNSVEFAEQRLWGFD